MSLVRADLLAALLAGTLGGACGGYFAGRSAPHRAPAAAVAAPDRADDDLATRVASLEAELTRLQQQRRAAPSPRAQGDSPPPSPAEKADPTRGRALVDDPVFETAVRDVMEKLQQERAGEREERRTQAQQRWADRLAEEAGLTDQQKAKALAIAQEMAEKMRDMRDSDAGPTSREAWVAQRDALRAQGEQRLAEVLSAKQMEVYRQSSDLQMNAGWGRGGRRGGGGPF
ncbi:MAG: hypothetical protein QM820_21710 [Minicystis sp.]